MRALRGHRRVQLRGLHFAACRRSTTLLYVPNRRARKLRESYPAQPGKAHNGRLTANQICSLGSELIISGNFMSDPEGTTFEKHYRVGELARLWGLGRETVRKLVKDEPDVIKIRLGRKKAHTIYTVPESVARRIHTRLLNAA
jgi:hypothetical protein